MWNNTPTSKFENQIFLRISRNNKSKIQIYDEKSRYIIKTTKPEIRKQKYLKRTKLNNKSNYSKDFKQIYKSYNVMIKYLKVSNNNPEIKT